MVSAQTRRWTRQEYERLIELGVLGEDDRVELIEGEIVEMTPQNTPHATGVRLAEDALRIVFGSGFDVRAQLPLALGERSEPEPDVAVVRGSPRDYAKAHPTSALLVVEVADTTLAHDRDTKGGMYAKAGVPDYWIVNLGQPQVEVHRGPVPMPSAAYGFGYRSRTLFLPGDSISPLAKPDSRVPVDDLLP